jgi:hypothetical protein
MNVGVETKDSNKDHTEDLVQHNGVSSLRLPVQIMAHISTNLSRAHNWNYSLSKYESRLEVECDNCWRL